jgi:hypothetical protein
MTVWGLMVAAVESVTQTTKVISMKALSMIPLTTTSHNSHHHQQQQPNILPKMLARQTIKIREIEHFRMALPGRKPTMN